MIKVNLDKNMPKNKNAYHFGYWYICTLPKLFLGRRQLEANDGNSKYAYFNCEAMWRKHHSKCVFFTSNRMFMQEMLSPSHPFELLLS